MLLLVLKGDEEFRRERDGRYESVGISDSFCSIGRRRGAFLARSTDGKEVRGFSHGLDGRPAGSYDVPRSGGASEKRSPGHRFDPNTLACRRFPYTVRGLDNEIFAFLFVVRLASRLIFYHLRILVLRVLRW